MIDIVIQSNSNTGKKEHKKLEKYQGLKEKLQKMWRAKATVGFVVIGARGTVTPKLGEWLQQIPGMTCEISVQKSSPRNSKDTAQDPQARA